MENFFFVRGRLGAMFVMDKPRPRRRPPPPFPTYDVKIVAGRRVVIFHDKKKDQNENRNANAQQTTAQITTHDYHKNTDRYAFLNTLIYSINRFLADDG